MSDMLGLYDDEGNHSSSMSTVEIISPLERMKRYGIECIGPMGDGITFRAGEWKPGGEYIQKLIVRNVSTSVKKLKYKLPATRYFSMAYPEVIILSPGMFQEIDVVFRPVEHAPYDDTIYMKMQEGPGSGGFHVPVRAMIEKLLVTSPLGVELGFCAAYQTTSAVFQLTNAGEVDAPFRWEAGPPFIIEPSQGLIPIGHSQDITVRIYPMDASVYVAQVACHVGEGVDALIPEPTLVTKFTAICKHTFIVLSESEVQFGEVLSGTAADSTVREVELRNNSVVPAEFELIRHENDRDEVFEVSPKRGVIPAMSELVVKVKYHALAAGVYSCDRYTYKTPGNSCTTLVCKGMSMPPKICLLKEMTGAALATGTFPDGSPANSINFRDVEIGKVETRIIFLKNDSSVDTTFCVIADEKSTFQIDPKQGRLPALAQYFPIKLIFSPTKPINYYRRLFVLIGDALPLFFDAMGSGHIRAKGEIKEQRPAPIRHAHIQAYRNREVDGYAGLNPDQLDELRRQGLGKNQYFAHVGLSGTTAMSVSAYRYPLTRTGESARNFVAPAHEFFIEDTDASARVVTINKNKFDFGYTPHHSTSLSHTAVITNHTNGKVSVVWNIPRIHGDTYEKSNLGKNKMLENASTTSTSLDLSSGPAEDDIYAPVFVVDPPNCDINVGKSQTFQITFRPLQSNRNYVSELEAFVFFKNQRTFRLVDDATLTPPWCLPVFATGHTFSSGQLLAKGKLTGGSIRGGKLVFPSCFVNESLYETVILRNTGNMPCTFVLQLGWESENQLLGFEFDESSHAKSNAFTVKPDSGEIDAGGFVLICIRFSPTVARKTYDGLVKCVINGSLSGKLLLEGTGEIPFLSCPDLIEKAIGDRYLGSEGLSIQRPIPQGFQGTFYLQPTCVGLSTSHPFTLKNSSRLPLRYQVYLPREAANIMSITPLKGLLKGNEETQLRISFAPQAAIRYDFKIIIKSFPVGGVAARVLDARQVGGTEPPEVLQTLRVTIVAPSAIGALTFDPPKMSVDVRLVSTFETKTIWIENVSDADLSYALYYQTDFTQDTGSIIQVCKSCPVRELFRNKDDAELNKRKQLTSSTVDSGVPIDPSSDEIGHSLYCEFPKGILPARSRKGVSFTFYPVNAGLFEFSVYARLTALDRQTGLPVVISNEEAALLRLSQVDRDLAASSLPPSPVNSAKESSSPTPYNDVWKSLPLMTHITGRAAFPTMVFEDIRASEDSLISDVEMLWSRFSLSELNHDLSIPPTEQELKLYSNSSPDLSQLKRYNFEFTPAPIGSPLQTVYLQIKNNGFLSTSFRAHLPNEKELDLEIWCDEDEPSEELNQIICIIEEMKVFSFEPKSAVLAPGESCIITMSYSHTFLKYGGLHKIPLLMKVSQGKMFYMDLIGKTIPHPHNPQQAIRPFEHYGSSQSIASGGTSALPPMSAMPTPGTASSQQFNQGSHLQGASQAQASTNISTIPDLVVLAPAATSDKCLELVSVPIGLPSHEAPRQRIELVNVSEVDAHYSIDMEALEELNKLNYEQPLIRLANPTGIILAKSSVFLEVYFYALEIKVYEFPVVVTYMAVSKSPAAGLLTIGEDSVGFGFPGSVPPPRVGSPKGAATQTASGFHNATLTLPSPSPSTAGSRAGTRKGKGGPPTKGKPTPVVPQPPQILHLNVKISGYDPRIDRPALPGALYRGGIPPSVPPMKVPGDFTTISADSVFFDLVPQCCTAHRLVILRNTLSNSSLEFYVDVTSSYLIEEGLLTVSPIFGQLEPGSHVTFDFKFKANAPPTLFSDRLKVVVRERIKDTGGRRSGGANSRLLEKIKTKKAPTDHDSVVSRPTSTISNQFMQKEVPYGRVASLPSTMSIHGLIEPAKQVSQSEFGGTGQFEMAAEDFGSSRVLTMTPSRQEASRNFSRSSIGSNAYVGSDRSATGGSRSNSPSASRVFSQAGGSNATSPSSRNGEGVVLLGPPRVLIVRLHGEVFTLDTVNNLLENGPLKGVMKGFLVPPQVPFIAPSVSIVPTPPGVISAPKDVSSSQASVNEAELAAANNGFIPPAPRSLSPLMESSASRSIQSSSQLAPPSQRGGNQMMKSTSSPSNKGLNSSPSNKNRSSPNSSTQSLPTVQNTSGRSSSPIPSMRKSGNSPSPTQSFRKTAGSSSNSQQMGAQFSAAIPSRHATQLTTPTPAMLTGTNTTTVQRRRSGTLATPVVPLEVLVKPREKEVRSVAEVVLFDLFRSILTSVPLREYTSAVQSEAAAASPLTGGLKWSPITPEIPVSAITTPQPLVPLAGVAENICVPVITGKPVCGVFFQEILPALPLHERLLRELKHMGYTSCDNNPRNTTIGVGTGMREALVPGIPSPWTKGDGKALLADASHFQLTRTSVMDAIKDLGLPSKGHTAKGVAAVLAEYSNDGGGDLDDMDAPVMLSKLIAMLPQPIWDKLSAKVNECYGNRLAKARKSRRALSLQSSNSLSLFKPIDDDERDEDAFEDASLPGTLSGASSSQVLEPFSPSPFARTSSNSNSALLPKSAKTSPVAGARPPQSQALQRNNSTGASSTSTAGSSVVANPGCKVSSSAAVAIQRVARGNETRVVVTKRVQELLDQQIQFALCQNSFMETASDILHNTMFNLIQEATYGEFPVTADPLKFVLKKSPGVNAT